MDSLDLRFPLVPAHAGLSHISYQVLQSTSGALPAGTGTVVSAPWASYWWLGDEERGLAGFCETDEAWDRVDRKDGFRIERIGESVDVVWSFVGSRFPLRKPWRFTFGMQATPVKAMPRYRQWRLDPGLHANLTIPWPVPGTVREYGYPQAANAAKYRALIRSYQRKGMKACPYSLLNYLSNGAPEAYYAEEWANGESWPSVGDVGAFGHTLFGGLPTREWVDFMVWANDRFVRSANLDGLYHDFTWPSTCSRPDKGFGYVRDGAPRPRIAIFGVREMYKRIYTMLKAYGREKRKETVMIGHASSPMYVPIVGFCDAYLDGEQFLSTVKDSYLDVVRLDQLRAEFMGHNYGVPAIFLPELSGQNAKAAEPTERLLGLALLHDFLVWPCWCNHEAANRVYAALDRLKLADAAFLPYWRNADLVAGQTDAVKCSVYRKPHGGALLCVVNTQRPPQTARLSVSWDRLRLPGAPAATDILTGQPVPVGSGPLVLELAPLEARLVFVR